MQLSLTADGLNHLFVSSTQKWVRRVYGDFGAVFRSLFLYVTLSQTDRHYLTVFTNAVAGTSFC